MTAIVDNGGDQRCTTPCVQFRTGGDWHVARLQTSDEQVACSNSDGLCIGVNNVTPTVKGIPFTEPYKLSAD